ncbi:hypothetical protein [Acidipropionibacterium acidipropionici]|jgi:hypothetical protein|uniref:hypothetical protein n=1 Tax=Acidipropionibacterium acidipropionici TaxID=1748 RepID=UPI00110B89C4|nr:hypothetical protein [Acidipropionibacterium acidipropionici]QCV94703.1 hypothetical protein FEZ30_04970 [Acidipropionibacterium acidipropionici]
MTATVRAAMTMAESRGSDRRPAPPPPAVLRWEGLGGTWRVLSVGEGSATVALCRCDGGEVAERLTLTEPLEVSWAEEAARSQ